MAARPSGFSLLVLDIRYTLSHTLTISMQPVVRPFIGAWTERVAQPV